MQWRALAIRCLAEMAKSRVSCLKCQKNIKVEGVTTYMLFFFLTFTQYIG